MSKVQFTKATLTYPQQLQQLKSRGMQVGNDARALHLLENVSYYRLSGYWYPLLADKQNHIFKQTASFETAFLLYCFDKELRKLMISELEKIEVAVRAKMVYILSHAHGAFWYQDANLFRNPVSHGTSISKIGEEFNRSDEEFIHAFKNKYSDPLPPSWIMMEIASFGILSTLFKNLKPIREKREIANYFGLADSVFETWLHSIVYLRNVCAHHTRVWNRAMRISPQLPRSPRKSWLNNTNIRNDRTYYMLCMIRYLLQTVNPTNSFKQKISALLQRFPNVDISAMNFPADWETEPLWQ